MSVEKSEKEFEAWALQDFGLREGHLVKGDDGEYLNYPTQCYFQVWQASRAAIEVELPIFTEFSDSDSPGYVLERCVGMIEYQGLKVKA
jgi:hypothetical protein